MTWIPDSIGNLSAHSFTLSAQPSKQQRHYAAQCLCSFELYHLEPFRWPLLTIARWVVYAAGPWSGGLRLCDKDWNLTFCARLIIRIWRVCRHG
jgi:hypothetical protein